MTSQLHLFESLGLPLPFVPGMIDEEVGVALADVPPAGPAGLPRLPAFSEVKARLRTIFDGTAYRRKASGVPATRTIYAMLYIGAVDGETWLRPCQVVRMGDSMATPSATDDERLAWRDKQSPKVDDRWYAENSREGPRDEKLRNILIPHGAVILKEGVHQNSDEGRYALAGDFASLFDPALSGHGLEVAIEAWRVGNLSPAALARVALMPQTKKEGQKKLSITFPNGEVRILPPGPGSAVAKLVIEQFATTVLKNPVLVAVTDGGKKIHPEDLVRLEAARLKIDPSVLLPDVILMDLGDNDRDVRIVFVEAVATGGAMTETRVSDLTKIAQAGGHDPGSVMCVSAFPSRDHKEARRAFPELPIGSYAWYADTGLLLPFFVKTSAR